MKFRKLIGVAAVSAMALALVACGKKNVTEEVVSEVIVPDVEVVEEVIESEIPAEIESELGPIDVDSIEGKEFLGTWQNDRCLIMIEPDSNGFNVHIHWASSYEEAADWQYFCLYNGAGLVNHGDGVKKVIKYDENGGIVSEEVEYDDSAVEFSLKDGKLIWNDSKETVEDNMEFEKSSEES